jgi:hypothetical protein
MGRRSQDPSPKPCPFPFKTCTTCLSSLPYTSCPSPPSHAMSCRAPLSSPPHLAPLSDGRTLVAARCACSRQLLSLDTAQSPLSPSHRRRSARRRVVCRRADLQGGTASPSLHQVEGLLLLLLELSVGWPWPGGHSLSLSLWFGRVLLTCPWISLNWWWRQAW